MAADSGAYLHRHCVVRLHVHIVMISVPFARVKAEDNAAVGVHSLRRPSGIVYGSCLRASDLNRRDAKREHRQAVQRAFKKG
eukprot:5698362-Pleurochrysis_carterae.AAC.1